MAETGAGIWSREPPRRAKFGKRFEKKAGAGSVLHSVLVNSKILTLLASGFGLRQEILRLLCSFGRKRR
jgi:hypothetical protein